MVLQVSRGLAMMWMMGHVVSVVVIAVANRVIVVIVGHNNSTILAGWWATVACVASGIVAIPHVDSLVICVGITPCGSSIINLHLPTNGGRRGLFPASWLHALILFIGITPGRGVLLHRTGTTPRTNATTPSTASAAAAAAFLGL